MNDVILVDSHDRAIDVMEKLEAHRQGRLHRAFSIFVFHPDGRMLLQQRSLEKYHCGGLWTNACCSHPRPGEGTEEAAHRRLQEEMGFDSDLLPVGAFTYRVTFPNGLIEHEYDHLFIGVADPVIVPDRSEVADFAWADTDALSLHVQLDAERYTYWFRIALPKILASARQSPSLALFDKAR